MIKKIIWCFFHLIRNEKTNAYLTALIYKCIWLIENRPNVIVDIDYYYISIKTSSSNIRLWNANKFYAWVSSGSVNGECFSGIQPSRSACYDFICCLKKHGYNIYQLPREERISIKEIKC